MPKRVNSSSAHPSSSRSRRLGTPNMASIVARPSAWPENVISVRSTSGTSGGLASIGADRSTNRIGADPIARYRRRPGTRPPSAPASVAGPRGAAIPSTRIALRPSESFSRPSLEPTSSPLSSRTRSRR